MVVMTSGMMESSSSSSVCPQFRVEQLNLDTSTPLGAGAISYVVKSTLQGPSELPIVVKIVSKLQVLQQNKINSVMNEKEALIKLQPHPFIARLYGTSQSEDELYFVMENLPNGDLLQHIRRTAAERVQDYANYVKSITTTTTTNSNSNEKNENSTQIVKLQNQAEHASSTLCVCDDAHESVELEPIPASSHALRCLDFHDIQLITAQLILALSHVASRGFVLRDLKPENVVFDDKYRACLIDFDTIDLEGCSNKPETNNGHALPTHKTHATSSKHNKSANNENSVNKENSDIVSNVIHCSSEHEKNNNGVTKSNESVRSEKQQCQNSSNDRRRITVSEIQEMRRRTASFCGTAQYVSPEMAGECKWSFSSDLWALGAMVYEMMYGVHMFSGPSTYYVLRKVIHGLTGKDVSTENIPFPYIDFSASHNSNNSSNKNDNAKCNDDDDDNNNCNESEAETSVLTHTILNMLAPNIKRNGKGNACSVDMFERVKDFIIQVMHIDPRERLGVNAATNTFDLHALQTHMLFDDFDWDVLTSHIRHYKPRTFHEEENAMSSELKKEKSTNGEECNTATMFVNDTPSLREFYHKLPRNDDEYAAYVAKATADANPFERFMNMISLSNTNETIHVPSSSSSSPSSSSSCSEYTSHNKTTTNHTETVSTNAEEEPKHKIGTTNQTNMNIEHLSNSNGDGSVHYTSNNDAASISDESDVEVIDDVGVHFIGNELSNDFQ